MIGLSKRGLNFGAVHYHIVNLPVGLGTEMPCLPIKEWFSAKPENDNNA